MPRSTPLQQPSISTLGDFFSALARRKGVLLVSLLVLPAITVLVSRSQSPLYAADASVLVKRENLALTLTGNVDPGSYQDPHRFAQTQAKLAESPEVARRTLDALDLTSRTPRDLLANTSIEAEPNVDLLKVEIRDRDPELAIELTNEYAREFAVYRGELDTRAISRLLTDVRQRIGELRDSGDQESPLYQSLVSKEQELQTIETLQTSNVLVTREADEAVKVQPRPVRAGLIAAVLGLGLGLILVFVAEAIDTRVRTTEELTRALGLPLLGKLPRPPRNQPVRIAMLENPDSIEAEAFRMARINIDFANLDRSAQAIMVTSAIEKEGKSTTIANLAVAFARTGRRVILVDLDLRRPFIARFFHAERLPGLTDVALGNVKLNEALVPVKIGAPEPGRTGGRDGAQSGTLHVLPSGPSPLDPGEFVTSRALDSILGALRERADLVLIDAPPTLPIGDAMALSAKVDALMVVSRVGVVRRQMLADLRRMLETAPAEVLGVLATGASITSTYGYGLYGVPRSGGRLSRVPSEVQPEPSSGRAPLKPHAPQRLRPIAQPRPEPKPATRRRTSG
ncbi:MAG: polysaccharide biosynthesis tyrosine autokinase, partial [Gaiellaceae bacterium]